MARYCIILGTLFGALGVTLGAFGAHGLKDVLPTWYPEDHARMMETWEIGVRYQMYHALALIGLGLFTYKAKTSVILAAGAFTLGILIFSGLLYALVLTNIKVLGAIVPIGGVAMIAGWAIWCWQAFRDPE